jgi:hypothetical protein
MNRIRYGLQTHFILEIPTPSRLISYWKRLPLEIHQAKGILSVGDAFFSGFSDSIFIHHETLRSGKSTQQEGVILITPRYNDISQTYT